MPGPPQCPGFCSISLQKDKAKSQFFVSGRQLLPESTIPRWPHACPTAHRLLAGEVVTMLLVDVLLTVFSLSESTRLTEQQAQTKINLNETRLEWSQQQRIARESKNRMADEKMTRTRESHTLQTSGFGLRRIAGSSALEHEPNGTVAVRPSLAVSSDVRVFVAPSSGNKS